MASSSVESRGLPDDFKSVSHAGSLGRGEQVPFVKVQQGAARGLVNALEDGAHFAGDLLYRSHVIAQKPVGRLRVTEAVDGFKDREPTAWLEDPEKLVQGLLFRLHVDQDGAGRDHIHRAGCKGSQIVSRGAHEPAVIECLQRRGEGSTMI